MTLRSFDYSKTYIFSILYFFKEIAKSFPNYFFKLIDWMNELIIDLNEWMNGVLSHLYAHETMSWSIKNIGIYYSLFLIIIEHFSADYTFP